MIDQKEYELILFRSNRLYPPLGSWDELDLRYDGYLTDIQDFHKPHMTNGPLPSVSSYTARNLSFKQLEAWSSAGAAHRDELKRIVKEIVRTLHHSSSPAKTLSTAMKKLESLFSRREVRGEVHLLNNRHINFRLAFPTTNEDGLVFCLLYGEINARTGAVKFDLTSPIQISLHALQRLFERLEDRSDAAVLDEIYSCIGQVIHWHKGATEIQAKCWPLISRHGFFIGTSPEDLMTTTVVTWIKGGRIGKKWGVPLYNLERLKEHHPERLEDSEFAQEFIRSFPWMLHEHVPGEDFIALAWEQRDDQDNGSPHEESNWDEKIDLDESDPTQLPKLSTSYVSGLNYRDEPPPFRTHSLHTGVVVQRRLNGSLIVGLKNGWVGQVPIRSINRGLQLISGYAPSEIGDDIVVTVHKINHYPNENAYALSLDPKEISDANWAEMEKEHPVDSIHSVNLMSKYNQEFMVQLGSGIRGVIAASDVQQYLSQPKFYGCNPIGQTVEAIVTGYRAEKKCLLMTIRNLEAIPPPESQSNLYPAGTSAVGRCIRNSSNFSLIELPHGVYGVFHKLNNWGRELPDIGTDVPVVVIESSDSKLLLAGPPPDSIEKIFYARPLSTDNWDQFIARHSVGDAIEVQNLFWRESSQCFIVATSDGVVGSMPCTEVDWFCADREEQKSLLKPGDMFQAMILKILPTKSRVVFSKKALDKHPMDEQISKIDLKAPIKGLVVNVLDYGCFVQLRPYGIQALLHRSKIPEGKNFGKGDSITVFIDSVDQINRRVSLKMENISIDQ